MWASSWTVWTQSIANSLTHSMSVLKSWRTSSSPSMDLSMGGNSEGFRADGWLPTSDFGWLLSYIAAATPVGSHPPLPKRKKTKKKPKKHQTKKIWLSTEWHWRRSSNSSNLCFQDIRRSLECYLRYSYNVLQRRFNTLWFSICQPQFTLKIHLTSEDRFPITFSLIRPWKSERHQGVTRVAKPFVSW